MNKIFVSNNTSSLPNASALIKSNSIGIKGNTGVPEISIPIYTISTQDLTIPIMLSYNASGIKVNQLASWVGLGWSLSAGGIITREIKGLADEIETNGYCYGGGSKLYNDIINKATYYPNNTVTYTNVENINIESFALVNYDGEPDVYNFSFGSYNGKFIFDKDRNVHFIPKTNLKIDVTRSLIAGRNTIQSFKITDKNGYVYTFNVIEKSKKKVVSFQTWLKNYCINYGAQRFNAPANLSKIYDDPNYQTNGWYLSDIEFPNKEHIKFNYSYDEPTYVSHTNETYYWRGDGCHNEALLGGSSFPNDSTVISKDFTTLNTIQPRINSIVWNEGAIVFKKQDQPREDINNLSTNKSFALSQILVMNKSGSTKLLNCGFSYSYFDDPGALNYVGNENLFKRLRLDGLNLNDQKYTFNYDTQKLPARISHEIDYWGYYKSNPPTACSNPVETLYTYIAKAKVWVNSTGASTSFYNYDNGIYYLFPELVSASSLYMILPGSDRRPDAANMQAGTLNSITNPTGGIITFEYEPHRFQHRGQNLTGGGLRIKKIIENERTGVSENIIKTFSYVVGETGAPSGICLVLPKLCKRDLFNESAVSTGCGIGTGGSNSQSRVWKYTTRLLDSQFDYGIFNGNAIVYSEIVETDNIEGRVTKKFLVDTDISHYFQKHYGKAITTTQQNVYLNFTNNDWLQDHYPPVPAFNLDWSNSVLIEETIYDINNKKVKKITYNYSPYYSSDEIIYALKSNAVFLEYFQELQAAPASFKDFRWNVYGYVTNWLKLKGKTEENYSMNYNTEAQKVVVTNNYNYNSDHLLNLTEIIDSENKKIRTHFKYPVDFPVTNEANPFSAAVKKMREKHILTPLIEEYIVTQNGETDIKVINGQFLNYKIIDNSKILPVEMYSLESIIDLDSGIMNGYFPSNYNTSTGFIEKNSNYKLHNKQEYDRYGNVLHTLDLEKNTSTSYLWNYDSVYLVAEIKNSHYDFNSSTHKTYFAYNSFENTSKGLFSYSGPIGNSVDCPTGNNYYLLASSPITCSNLDNTFTYILSCWIKDGTVSPSNVTVAKTGKTIDGWTYNEFTISNTNSISISGTAKIDELRLLSSDAIMKTFTWNPLIGVSCYCDENNRISYYKYDCYGRLLETRDQDKNLLKTYDYHYSHQ